MANATQKHNRTQVRADDYSFIGAFMGILLGPAIFLKRANILQLAAGGASLGLGAGVWVHLAKSLTEGNEIKPEAMVSGAAAAGDDAGKEWPLPFREIPGTSRKQGGTVTDGRPASCPSCRARSRTGPGRGDGQWVSGSVGDKP